MGTGQSGQAVLELAALTRVAGWSSEHWLSQMALLAPVPGARAQLVTALRFDPALRQSFLSYLASKQSDGGLVFELAQASRLAAAPQEIESWQQAMIDQKLKAADVEEAFRIWAGALGLNARRSNKLVLGGEFKGRELPGPFGWQLLKDGPGAAERSNSGLQIAYYGREGAELARQLLRLPPGRYQLRAEVAGSMRERSAISFRINCLQNNSELLTQQLAKIMALGGSAGGEFTVPGNCVGQWLTIAGTPSEFPETENIVLERVAVERVRP
jgi:hypothetical protein